MPLRTHIDPNKIAKDKKFDSLSNEHHTMSCSSRFEQGYLIKEGIPKYKIPKKSLPPGIAYRIIKDEISLDTNTMLNCATFLTTWMDDEAMQLINENIAKNFVDQDGFPSSQIIHERCISMLAHLWKVPEGLSSIGTVCGGSSEALMLGCLAMKWQWREKRKQKGLDFSKPNLVFGAHAHCCVEKFARYFDVESRIIPVKKESNYVTEVKDIIDSIDENTIGVVSILGSTYSGHFENVQLLSDELDKLHKTKGFDVNIHVDGASGGFIAPFAFPDLKWSFEVNRVSSINASGHKFGLVYAGIGWVLWKDKELLHKDLIFELHYLGTTEYSFTLNFSRPTSHIFAQYYNFIRLGTDGYTSIMNDCMLNARLLSYKLEQSGYFDILSDIHRKKGNYHQSSENKAVDVKDINNSAYNYGLPLVAFNFSKKVLDKNPKITTANLANLMKSSGWLIPSYNLPMTCESTMILRIVVKESMSRDMIENLSDTLIASVEALFNSDNKFSEVFEAFQNSCSINTTSAQSNPSKKIQKPTSSETKLFARPC